MANTPSIGAAAASPVGAAGAVLSAVAGQFGELQRTLTSMVDSIQDFVKAIAPGVVMEFQQALKDVQATIGTAFTGAVSIFANVAREIGGILLPAMQELKPIIDTLANAMGTQLTAVVRVAVSLFQAFAPVLQIVADGLNEFSKLISDMLGIVTALIKTFTAMFASVFGTDTGGFREAFKGLADIVRSVVKALISLYATLNSFLGEDARNGLRLFADTLEKEAKDRDARAAGVKATANNPGVSDVASILQRAQLAAFTAAGAVGVREKSDTEYFKEIADSVRKAADSKDTITDALKKWWDTEVVGGSGILGVVLRFVNSLQDKIRRFLEKFTGG